MFFHLPPVSGAITTPKSLWAVTGEECNAPLCTRFHLWEQCYKQPMHNHMATGSEQEYELLN